MKKFFILLSFVLFSALLIMSCATGSGTATVLDKSFQPANSKIYLLPPRFKSIDIGLEQSTGRMIYNSLVQRTTSEWLSQEEAVSLIQDANVLNEYESLIDGYQKTGIPSKSKLLILSETVKCPYIALCQIDYEVTGAQSMSNYRIAGLTVQVLSANDGKVVLEIVGNAECGYGSFDIGAAEVMQKAIDEAISHYPGARPTGK